MACPARFPARAGGMGDAEVREGLQMSVDRKEGRRTDRRAFRPTLDGDGLESRFLLSKLPGQRLLEPSPAGGRLRPQAAAAPERDARGAVPHRRLPARARGQGRGGARRAERGQSPPPTAATS